MFNEHGLLFFFCNGVLVTVVKIYNNRIFQINNFIVYHKITFSSVFLVLSGGRRKLSFSFLESFESINTEEQ